MVDANNLYSGVMHTHKLPAHNIKTIGVRTERNNQDNEYENSMSKEESLASSDNSDYGKVVEVDLTTVNCCLKVIVSIHLYPLRKLLIKNG